MRPESSELLAARERIAPFIHRTPVLTSSSIDTITGARLFFKCENFQKTGSFKMRGAASAITQLAPDQASMGVATHSSGNFAGALARAARERGLKSYIVMPRTAPEVKRRAVEGYGAEIITCEPTLQARQETLARVVAETGATFIHPYDQVDVIAGQATACMELLDEVAELDYVVVPVGGGGLAAGTALAAHYFGTGVKVVAGEPAGADDAYRSLAAGKIIPSVEPSTIADGLLTSLGECTFPILSRHLEEIIRVEDEEIVGAMRLVWERLKIVIEPSGAVSLAAIRSAPEKFKGLRIGVLLSGGNIDLNRLPF